MTAEVIKNDGANGGDQEDDLNGFDEKTVSAEEVGAASKGTIKG